MLVANRGEIACRIMRTAHRIGLRTVAIYSEADAGALHVAMADQAICVGPAPAAESYLNIPAIIAAARTSGATAIHPGYGFLSENAAFASAVETAGLTFIGPPSGAIAAMADKAAARRRMLKAGVPCVPGYEGEDQSEPAFAREADRIGYPVMIKAAAGGGGRGMRRVTSSREFAGALTQARAEAASAFGDGALILEKAVENARHVEIQIFADQHGGMVHLGERDCSVQRRHQKVIEESPCPVVTPDLRARMGEAAILAAGSVAYVGAGTVEFLLEPGGDFHFLEMNTRLQVEHPVTEMVTGLDLVELQFLVARGEALPASLKNLQPAGHAIEARLYAENPAAGFIPSPGRLDLFHVADIGDVRIDTGVRSGDAVTADYDPMLAKIIAHGTTRDDARNKLRRALQGLATFGVATNRDFLLDVLDHPVFATGAATTTWVDQQWGTAGFDPGSPPSALLACVGVLHHHDLFTQSLAASLSIDPALRNWSSASALETVLEYDLGAEQVGLRVRALGGNAFDVSGAATHRVQVVEIDGLRARLVVDDETIRIVWQVNGRRISLSALGRTATFVNKAGLRRRMENAHGGGAVVAPMHGRLVALDVAVGAAVKAGDRLGVLEAMKMQHALIAGMDGRVARILAAPGAQIAARDVILEIEPPPVATAEGAATAEETPS